MTCLMFMNRASSLTRRLTTSCPQSILPFALPQMLGSIILTLFPPVALWLPALFFGR